ncbi:hypothetical protein L1049_008684 [Liquidambar formosana]|uniref:Uncharacterized protein n=1 Tax=Liquidambar formosana TaxID=63359 RepID=A0AAP0X2H5_LIQFO
MGTTLKRTLGCNLQQNPYRSLSFVSYRLTCRASKSEETSKLVIECTNELIMTVKDMLSSKMDGKPPNHLITTLLPLNAKLELRQKLHSKQRY